MFDFDDLSEPSKPVTNRAWKPDIKAYKALGWDSLFEMQEVMVLIVWSRDEAQLDEMIPVVAALPAEHPDRSILIAAGKLKRSELQGAR